MKLDPRLLREAFAQRSALTLTVGLGLGAGVLTVFQARMLSRVIHQVFLEGKSFQEVIVFLYALLALILLRAVLVWGSEASAGVMAVRIKAQLRLRLFERLLNLGPAYLRSEQARSGELAEVLTEGVEALDAYFSQYLPQLVLAAGIPLTILAFIFPLDLLSGLIFLCTAPLIPVFMTLIGSLAETLTRRQWLSLRRMSAYFLDIIQGLATLKTLGRGPEQLGMIRQVSDRYRRATMGVLRVTFLSALVLELAATISIALVAVQIGLRLLSGQGGLSFEEAFLILILAPEFYLPLRTLGARFHAGMTGVATAERIYEILEAPAFSTQGSVPCTQLRGGNQPDPILGTKIDISFEKVSYTYPDGRNALKEVSFRLEPGCKTALVGPSGSGKSTIAYLLLGFIQPQSGRIQAGGISLEAYPKDQWRHNLAWVSQNPTLFGGTVAENIRLARPEASLEEVMEAARQAQAHQFIMELPQGYDTFLGERGARLSAGQAQRVALARAFLKDAPLLIMDEPTSNLDPETEAVLQAVIARLTQGRTTLVIAHRLNTVRDADRILVLENGQLVEAGAHADLLVRGGLYARLINATCRTSEQEQRVPEGRLSFESDSVITPPPQYASALVSEISTPRAAVTPFLRLLKLASPFAGWIALSAFLGFATVACGIGLMSASAYIIARAALQPSIADLQVAIVGVRFFGLGRGVFRYLDRYLSHDVTLRLLERLRAWFYAVLEPLSPARLMGFFSGDLLSRIVGDISNLENFYVRALAPPLVAILSASAATIFLSSFAYRVGAAHLLFMVCLGAIVPVGMHIVSRSPGQRLTRLRADLSSAVVEGIQGMADLLAFGQQGRQLARIETLGQELAKTQFHMARLQAFQNALGNFLAALGMAVALMLAIPLVGTGKIEGVYLPVIVLAALSSFEAVLPLPLAAQFLENNLESARRLFEIVDAQPAIREPAEPLPVPERFDLEVRNLRFRYPTLIQPPPSRQTVWGMPLSSANHSYALDDVSFSLPAGGRLAIVGPSGAGKSTLVHLLLRFWEYEEGEIWLGGKALRSYSSSELRRRMGVVSQNTYLFATTVRENLLIARPRASQEDLFRAASAARMHDFIMGLPQGYDTWIGEGGLRLSAGQRQRLAIARALLKDAPLLILDEATANLDPITEKEIIRTLYQAAEGRSILVITHRLVGLESMDEILVIQDGRVIERGRHAELLERGGLYRRMWELQTRI